jgi:hypothetical protein
VVFFFCHKHFNASIAVLLSLKEIVVEGFPYLKIDLGFSLLKTHYISFYKMINNT